MNNRIKILHLEDLSSDAELVDRMLRKSTLHFDKKVVSNRDDFVNALVQFIPDVILSDHSLPSFDSQEALSIVKSMQVNVPFILVTATVSEEYAVEVMKEGAYDYILKDRLQRLPSAITSALSKYDLQKQAEQERIRHQQIEQKLITETSVRVQEKEREEIGRELHDNINQILASGKLYLEAATGDDHPSSPIIQKGIERLVLAMNEIRQLSHRLVAPALESISLTQAIGELAENSKGIGQIQLHFDAQFDENLLKSDMKLMLYRVVQEQFNNIIKHSGASNATILVRSDSSSVILMIKDDGRGFDSGKTSGGIGIRNITNRVKLFNGKITLESVPGNGCTLLVTIPLTQ